jgi:hypothetical protein
MEFTSRVATAADATALRAIMDAAIGELQRGFLTDEQTRRAGRSWESTTSSSPTAPTT